MANKEGKKVKLVMTEETLRQIIREEVAQVLTVYRLGIIKGVVDAIKSSSST
jgi:hypothetical protein